MVTIPSSKGTTRSKDRKNLPPKICQRCEKSFFPIRFWQRFCSLKCQRDHYNEINQIPQRLREYRKQEKEREEARTTGQEMRFCDLCGLDFLPETTWQKFCSNKCRLEHFRMKNRLK